MALVANVLNNLIPVSNFNKGQASKIFDRLSVEKELIVLKNNQPSAVILSEVLQLILKKISTRRLKPIFFCQIL